MGIRPAPCNGDLILLLGSDPNIDGRRLARIHWEPLEDEVNMGEAIVDPGGGGGICADIRVVIPGCCSGNTDFWLRDVSGDLPH